MKVPNSVAGVRQRASIVISTAGHSVKQRDLIMDGAGAPF